MNPLDIGKAADTGQEFVGFNTALEEFFEHKISIKKDSKGQKLYFFAINTI